MHFARAATARPSVRVGELAARAVYEQLRQLFGGRVRGGEHDCSAAPLPAMEWNEVAEQEMQVNTANVTHVHSLAVLLCDRVLFG